MSAVSRDDDHTHIAAQVGIALVVVLEIEPVDRVTDILEDLRVSATFVPGRHEPRCNRSSLSAGKK